MDMGTFVLIYGQTVLDISEEVVSPGPTTAHGTIGPGHHQTSGGGVPRPDAKNRRGRDRGECTTSTQGSKGSRGRPKRTRDAQHPANRVNKFKMHIEAQITKQLPSWAVGVFYGNKGGQFKQRLTDSKPGG